MSEMNQPNHRKYERLSCRCDVKLATKDNIEVCGILKDVSVGAIFVYVDTECPSKIDFNKPDLVLSVTIIASIGNILCNSVVVRLDEEGVVLRINNEINVYNKISEEIIAKEASLLGKILITKKHNEIMKDSIKTFKESVKFNKGDQEYKMNCWEYFKCGKDVQSKQEDETKKVCNVSITQNINHVNSGRNAGRICWDITGSLCDTFEKGDMIYKEKKCETCEFKALVEKEERENYRETCA